MFIRRSFAEARPYSEFAMADVGIKPLIAAITFRNRTGQASKIDVASKRFYTTKTQSGHRRARQGACFRRLMSGSQASCKRFLRSLVAHWRASLSNALSASSAP
jgi:hypothetical protein